MAQAPKISVIKVLQVLFTFVMCTTCIVAMIGAASIEDDKTIDDRVEVRILGSKRYHALEEQQILNQAIVDRKVDLKRTPIGEMDLNGMEEALKKDPWILDAQCHIENKWIVNAAGQKENQYYLHIDIEQRIPVARMFTKDNGSYYVDKGYHPMPLPKQFNFYTPVVTNVPYLGKDSLGDVIRQEILYVVNTLQRDSFWSAQSAQIVFNDQHKFELMPVAGNQRIILGDTSRLKDKLENVYLFYVHVLNKIGWDKYEVLDARFANQVVASPSLPYKGPVDKSAHDFDWVNSIVVTQARIDSVHQEADIRKAEAASKASAAKLAKARLESKGKGKLNIPILMPSVHNSKVNAKNASKSIPTPSKANVVVKKDAKGAKAAKPAERIVVPDLKAKKEKESGKDKEKEKEKVKKKEAVKEKDKVKESGKEKDKVKLKEKEKVKEKVKDKESGKVKEKVKERAKEQVKEVKKEQKEVKKEEQPKPESKVPKAVLQENKN